MIKIAAVDDELHVLERFGRMVGEIKELELCGLFETGEQLLDYLRRETLDAVFLDIEMPGTNGLQLTDQILDLNENMEIVFVTAYNQHAVEAFELQALDYILKPLTQERLWKTVRRLLKNKRAVSHAEKPFIQCFGDFEVFVNGEALAWKNSKAKEVLAFLVHSEGLPLCWERISDAVWPDFDSQKAHSNFHATTYLLRKRLAEAGISRIMENSRGNYRVVTEQIDCDVYQLEALIKSDRFKRKEDRYLLEGLIQTGYMERSGYVWAYPKAAALDERCRRLMDNFKENKTNIFI